MNLNQSNDEISIRIFPPEDESRFEYINNKEVTNLCSFLYHNSEFFVYASSIINDCININDLPEYLKIFYSENFGDDLSEEDCQKNNEFIRYIYSLYSNYGEEQDQFGKIRGAILERLTLLLILNRYAYIEDIYLPIKEEILNDNCQLNVDCKIKVLSSGWTTQNSIDIAGWNQGTLKGEGYECKLKIPKMEESDNDILYNLDINCESSPDIREFNVGVVTFSNVEANNYFEYLEDNARADAKVKLYGRNNLEALKEI